MIDFAWTWFLVPIWTKFSNITKVKHKFGQQLFQRFIWEFYEYEQIQLEQEL